MKKYVGDFGRAEHGFVFSGRVRTNDPAVIEILIQMLENSEVVDSLQACAADEHHREQWNEGYEDPASSQFVELDRSEWR